MTKRHSLPIVLPVLLTLAMLAVCLLLLLSGRGVPWLPVAMAQGSTTRYVALGGECGTIPCYAHPQDAVDAAREGDIIKVAQGVYTSTTFQVVYINKAITLTGGYTTTDWVNSYPLTRPTVIDAENVARRRGVYIDGTGVATITLEGLTIQRGNAQGTAGGGGGICILTGTVVLQDSHILSNTTRGEAQGAMGGGVYMGGGLLVLSENLLQGNTAGWSGGGVYIREQSTAVLSENTFRDNSAEHSGGGLDVEGGRPQLTLIELHGNIFQGNTSTHGGGAYLRSTTAILSKNSFHNNSVTGEGGAIHIYSGDIAVDGNTILANHADKGGGIFFNHVTGYLSSNTLQSNSASQGGGVYVDSRSYQTDITVNHNTIISNSANTLGGGMFVGIDSWTNESSDVALHSNIIYGNTANTAGGGVAISWGQVRADNNIIANNTSLLEGVYLSGGALSARHCTIADNGKYALTTNGGSAVITNTIVASHTLGGFAGFNITADHALFFNSGTPCSSGASCTNDVTGNPAFINAGAMDYHIGPDSAAIDAGVDAGVTTDIDGDPRPIGDGFDIGADEYFPVVGVIYLPVTLKNYSP